eukprot:8051601-Pyramimonas_sp.AAC.1
MHPGCPTSSCSSSSLIPSHPPPHPIPPLSSLSWGMTASPALSYTACSPTFLVSATRLGIVVGWAGGVTRSV